MLFAVDEAYLTESATSPFTAAIALYPWCGPTRIQKLNAPLLSAFQPPHRYLSYTVGRNPEAAAHAEADARASLATHLKTKR